VAEPISINRAPVLTLWATVVAEHLGYHPDAALTLGKCLAGLNAQSKGRSLGIFRPPKSLDGKAPKKVGLGEEFWVELCGRPLPARNTEDGIRAVVKDKPIDPQKVRTYLDSKFGGRLDDVRAAMGDLAGAFEAAELIERAYRLYEQFRPKISPGRHGWGAKGTLDLELIRSLAQKDT